MLFLTSSWRFLRSAKLEKLEFKLEKIMQEKLEKSPFLGQISIKMSFQYQNKFYHANHSFNNKCAALLL